MYPVNEPAWGLPKETDMTNFVLTKSAQPVEFHGFGFAYGEAGLRVWNINSPGLFDETYHLENLPFVRHFVLIDRSGKPTPFGFYRYSGDTLYGSVGAPSTNSDRLNPGMATPPSVQSSTGFDELIRKQRETQAWQRLGTSIAQTYRPRSW